MNSTIFQKQPKLSLSLSAIIISIDDQQSRINDHRSLIPMKWPISRTPCSENETPGITKTIDRYLTGSRIRDRWIGSSSRCDNATVKLSRGRKILSQFKFHREDDPLQVSG